MNKHLKQTTYKVYLFKRILLEYDFQYWWRDNWDHLMGLLRSSDRPRKLPKKVRNHWNRLQGMFKCKKWVTPTMEFTSVLCRNSSSSAVSTVNLIYIKHWTWHYRLSLLHWEEVRLAIIRPTSHFNICHASRLQWCSGTSRPLTLRCGCGGSLRPISCWRPQSWFWDTVASVLHGGRCWSPPPDDKMITKFGFITSTSYIWWLIESCCS